MRTDVMEPLPYEHETARDEGLPRACTFGERPGSAVHVFGTCPGCRAWAVTQALLSPTAPTRPNDTGRSESVHSAMRRSLELRDPLILVHFDREMARRWPELVAGTSP